MGLDTVELIMEVEKKFNISIPDEEAVHLNSVGKVADYVYIHQKLDFKIEKSEIDKLVINVVSDKSGIPRNKIKLYHFFTKDLGMD